jgi:Ca2+-binding EF-hand superfamily protein/RNA polymerase subunit RPABC4/transcription elongation factor Spt4
VLSQTGDDGMTDENEDVAMAECGSCRAVVPITSTNCPECNISFSGVSDDALGECGACNSLVPLDSTKCPDCGVVFVADDVIDILRTWMATNSMDVKTLFGRFDTNGDGRIDSDELKAGLLSLNLADLPPSQVDKLVQAIDEDGDSLVDLEELQAIIGGENLKEEAETITNESNQGGESLEYNENVLSKVMIGAEINDSDKEEFLAFAQGYNSDDNSYLKKDELQTAADAWNAREEVVVSDSEAYESEEAIKAAVEETVPEDSVVEEEEDDEEEDVAEESEVKKEVDVDELDTAEELKPEDAIESVESGIESERDASATKNLIDDESDTKSTSEIIEELLEIIDEQDISLQTAFGDLDQDGNRMLSMEELHSKLNELLEMNLSESEISALMESMDSDKDGNIDMIEFVNAIEKHEDSIASLEDEEAETVKTFPTKWHTRFMSKKWHDVFWPLIHTGLAIMIVAALANGLFPFVDGAGGTVELETSDGNGWMNDQNFVIDEGQAYSCEPKVQVGECKNSLTPLAGEASSMPGGFYIDGIILMIFSTLGLIGSLYTHLVLAPSWRARVKAMKEVSEDKADVQESLDDESKDSEEELQEDFEEEVREESEEEESEEEESNSGSDELDIGSYVGVDIDGEEYYGTIVEFDDEEDTVTIEEDESGDEITAYQDEMFIPED